MGRRQILLFLDFIYYYVGPCSNNSKYQDNRVGQLLLLEGVGLWVEFHHQDRIQEEEEDDNNSRSGS